MSYKSVFLRSKIVKLMIFKYRNCHNFEQKIKIEVFEYLRKLSKEHCF